MFGSFLPSLGWFSTTKVYSGMGADIVMESLHSLTLTRAGLNRSGLFFENLATKSPDKNADHSSAQGSHSDNRCIRLGDDGIGNA